MSSARVAIVGGGPAGATAALRLARYGHNVTLFERAAARRDDGESLNPGIWPLFDVLPIEAPAGLRIDRSLVRWSGEEVVDRRHRIPQLAVMRASFDAALLAAAADAGARVVRATATEDALAEASFVIDASGRASWSRAARERTSPPAIAMRGIFRGEGLPREARVEALENAWLWGSPMPDGSFSAIACVDASAGAGASQFIDLLRSSQLFRDLRNAVSLHCSDATTYEASPVIDTRVLLAGDAAHSLDPLSSSGVRSAMQSALHASIVVNTIVRHPDRAPLALRFYDESQRAAVAEHTRWTRAFYAESRFRELPFWRARAAVLPSIPADLDAGVALAIAPGVTVADVACVVGDVIESRRGITVPTLARPFVWLGGIEAVRLLEPLAAAPRTRDDLVRAWRPLVAEERGRRIVEELVRAGVVVSESAPIASR
ncbi:MAG TPA: FAD-dependent oxidoreductase [Thermoanaerobaculia bacterium]|nr:FAD-dependent oxidoreductase [Thermoanaerobaculia bacterium]